jgi:S1-C subfamily serine protease
MRKSLSAVAAACLAASALAGCGATEKRPVVSAALTDQQLIKAAGPGVVAIRARAKYGLEDEGSGFMIDKQHVMTAAHVVHGAASLKVRFSNGTQMPAVVVGSNDCTDQAVLKLSEPVPNAAVLPISADGAPAPTTKLDLLGFGSNIQAFGHETMSTNALAVTNSIVRHPQMPDDLPAVSPLIQNSPGAEPGSSGGALLTADGEVAGMMVISNTKGTQSYAIPASSLREQLPTLLGGDQHDSPGLDLLGFDQVDLNGYYGSSLGPDVYSWVHRHHYAGLFVDSVQADSPADQAGLQRGDIIYMVKGVSVSSMGDMCSALQSTSAGERITLHAISIDAAGYVHYLKKTMKLAG